MKSIKKFFNKIFGKKVEPVKKVKPKTPKPKTPKAKRIAYTGINQKVIERYPSVVIGKIGVPDPATNTLVPIALVMARTIKFYDNSTKSTNLDTVIYQEYAK